MTTPVTPTAPANEPNANLAEPFRGIINNILKFATISTNVAREAKGMDPIGPEYFDPEVSDRRD